MHFVKNKSVIIAGVSTIVVIAALALCWGLGVFQSGQGEGFVLSGSESPADVEEPSEISKPPLIGENLDAEKEPSETNGERPALDIGPEENDEGFAKQSFAYGNTSGNIANGGMVAIQGDKIYFANANDQSRLYSIKIDGSDYKKLLHFRASSINTYGDSVYYIGKGINYVDFDGYNQGIGQNGKKDCLNVVDSKIFYIDHRDGVNVFTMDLNGENLQRLNYNASGNLMVVGGRIYCTNEDDGGRIYSMDKSGRDVKKINDDRSGCLNVVGDRIYYVNHDDNSAIYSIGIDGDERIKINDEPSGHINVVGDRIYYASIADNQSIYSISTDGEYREKLNDAYSKDINIAGDRIFYISENDTLHTMKTDGSDGQSVFEWATSAPIPDSPITLVDAYRLYSDFIVETVRKNPSSDYDGWERVSLIYAEKDNIPALVMRSSNEYPYKYWLCTASSGKLQSVLVDSISYIEHGNLIYDTGRWNQNRSDIIYTIQNGEFVIVHEGHYIENGQGEWPDNYTWYWDDQEVSYSEYEDFLAAAFDNSIASYLSYDYSATSALRLLRGEPALTDGEARALALAQTWLEDHAIDVYVDWVDALLYTLTWCGEEYYLVGNSVPSSYWFNILVHTKTDEMLVYFVSDGAMGGVLIRPLYDYFFDDGSLAKQTTFDDAVLKTPDDLSLYIKWDDGSDTAFFRGYHETVWRKYEDDYSSFLVNPIFSYRGEAFTFTISSDSERYYLYENGHGTFGDKTFTWSYYIFDKPGMW